MIEQLRDHTGESAQLFVREGHSRRCVVSLQSPHALRWIVPEGVLFPLDVGSAGRVLSAGPRATAGSRASRSAKLGVASVSAPVRDGDGQVIAAVSVSGPIERMSRDQAGFGSRVVAAAAR